MIIPRTKPFRFFSAAVAVGISIWFSQSLSAQEEPTSSKADSPREWLHWKMFNLHPHVAARATYDDNINLRQTNVLSDIIYSVSPGISVVGGDPLSGELKLLTLDYTANLQFFSEHTEFNSVDQSAKFSGVLPFAKLTLGAKANYDKASTPDVELGNRVTRGLYGVALTARYELSPKTSIDLNGDYHATDYPDPDLIGSREFSVEGRINNQITSKINLGVGLTIGKLDQDRGAKQTFERTLIHATYTLTSKLDLTISAGGEWRQYGSFSTPNFAPDGTNFVFTTNSMGMVTTATNILKSLPIRTASSASFSPVFNIGAIYRPKEGTSIHLDAFRRDQNSATLAGFNYTATGFSTKIEQRFWERFSASFGGSYEISSYHSGPNNQSSGLENTAYEINAGLNLTISEKWTAGITALHRSGTSSDVSGIIFENNQVTLQTSYKF